jgi:aspartate carbamoyltransferase catalytic subunit
MKHFLSIDDYNKSTLESLLDRAFHFKQTKNLPHYSEYIAHLFYENSTRTRTSFEIACARLGMHPILVNLQHSSENKGETLVDTFDNLVAMGISSIVIRHPQKGIPHHLASLNRANIINAGDGQGSHPSQALLDLMTIIEIKKNISNLKIVILGDIMHSRVANSLQTIFKVWGVENLTLIGPEEWVPAKPIHGKTSHSLKEGISKADVVICLRVQKERFSEDEVLDLSTYQKNYRLTNEVLAFSHPEVMVMHPGPMNRGIEITSEVADGKNSYILAQVKNGVFARMAILEMLTN